MDHTKARLELWAIILISVASVLSAWCAYQSARWGNASSQAYSRAGARRTESLRQSGVSNRKAMIDVNLFVAYEDALASKNTQFAAFLSQRFPQRLRVATKAWEATRTRTGSSAPSSPFVMKEYHLDSDDQADSLERQAESFFETGLSASENGNRYVLLTVLFASVSFLAGVGSKFDARRIVMAALLVGSIVLLTGIAVLATRPIW
ncbi:MAG: hypothetical protein JO219_08960 [Candidatus Eremiobacteraeota bacterium]|nr:hypothetical protein [Candidatus Eremiobacteraeota bacterium]MBV8365599.1 hypothetical protein [Candidatus Eremiobacteraeota bacterium]